MSLDQSQAADAADEPVPQGRINRLVNRLLNWATATRLRLILTSVAGLTALGLVFAAWSYLGQVALEPLDPKTAELALAAYDQGNYSEAKSIVGQMQSQPAPQSDLAKALFVLGAVKARDAQAEASAVRRSAMYEVAARYLEKARKLELPDERAGEACFLLGKSLVCSGQWHDAIPLLEQARLDPALPATEIYRLLVEAIVAQKESDLPLALSYNEHVLADAQLPPEQRQEALLQSGGILLRLGKYADAREALLQIPAEGLHAAKRTLLLGRLDIEEAQSLPADSPQRAAKLESASQLLERAKGMQSSDGVLARQAALWTARCFALRGQDAAALAEFERIVQEHPGTSEGLGAGLAAADYYRRQGNFERALTGFRRVLRAAGGEDGLDNPLMPKAEVRQRLTDVYQQCVDEAMFAEALVLVDLFEPLFGRASCAELRARALQRWGERRLDEAAQADAQEHVAEQEGRFRLRAAGQAHEQLARLRFASAKFGDDLWNAADCYFRGRSFTHAARVLQEYLHHESQRRNAMALLRLGQSHLAGQSLERAIDSFQQCMETYPDDLWSSQARLECARAYELQNKFAEAEQLLLTNLVGKSLTPASSEWRDSLFELGGLLYQLGRYDEAIGKLDEAIRRYPDWRQSLWAQYTLARCHHCAAEASAARLAESKTENERQAARVVLTDQLGKAHECYQRVQREITLRERDGGDPIDRVLLRNCYLMQGAVLVDMRRFDEAIVAFGSVITSYQNDPVSLESFLQVANCWRRLGEPVKARVMLDQARMVLKGMPEDADFLATTNFNRQQWDMLLTQMSDW
ncbi:MAG: tetratricopeptide repeat protein [Pirellulales bacterium]|nr:tetratricopeptide repeat protein [Pirellulales bacterium]